MFNNSGMFTIKSNINDELYNKIEEITVVFHKVLIKQIKNNNYNYSFYRILKPFNLFVLIDMKSLHFIFTTTSGGSINITVHKIIENLEVSFYEAIKISIDQIGFIEPFGFTIPLNILDKKKENLDNLIIPYVNEYINNEASRLERIEKTVRINPLFQGRDFLINEKLCFVLMPFHERRVQEIYEDIISTTVNSLGFLCKRADDIYGTAPIIEDIWQNINESNFIIADVTGRNPNVFYEVGIAHTVGKKVIIITQDLNDVPFDLRHLRFIIYENTSRGASHLKENLKLSIEAIKK